MVIRMKITNRDVEKASIMMVKNQRGSDASNETRFNLYFNQISDSIHLGAVFGFFLMTQKQKDFATPRDSHAQPMPVPHGHDSSFLSPLLSYSRRFTMLLISVNCLHCPHHHIFMKTRTLDRLDRQVNKIR